MRRTLLLLAGLLMGFAPAPFPKQRRADDDQRDLQAMQGAWTDRFADSAAVSIVGDRMEYASDYAWKLTLNARATPKRIKAIGIGPRVVGKFRRGIYRLEKDKIIICWSRGSVAKMEWPINLDHLHKDVWVEVFTAVKR
jgi:uncharacterized protein (TIGR03067 family)